MSESWVEGGWEYATTSGPRKAWADETEPPDCRPGWELDPGRGRPGESWERFDYHEERYWRRKVDDRVGDPTPADPAASLAAWAAAWDDTPAGHQRVFTAFDEAFRRDEFLVEHREHVERNNLGFGYPAFHHLWHLVAQDMPDGGRFLEVGVHKGQSVVAVGRCLARLGKAGTVVGLSPYDARQIKNDGPENLLPVVLAEWEWWVPTGAGVKFVPAVADSQSPLGESLASQNGPYHAVYVDGDHGYGPALHDLKTYGGMVKPGGLLIADDAAWNLNVPQNPAWFRGMEGCSRAVDDLLPPKTPNPDWTHVGLLGHLRAWRRA